MLSSCLLSGLIIGVISTGVYALITDKKENNLNKKDKEIDACIIFSIIMVVSVSYLFFTNKNIEAVVPLKGGISPKVNNQPPF